MQALIRNIKLLAQLLPREVRKVSGKEMASLRCLEDAYLLIEDGCISSFGKMEELKPESGPVPGRSIIDATGRVVLPCWCDSHTHLVWAGNRDKEFTDRIRGLSYEEIARRDGGILNSARMLNDTPEEALLEESLPRLEEIKSSGTGAVEIKSGYGLTPEGELKMLRVIRRLREHTPLTIRSTFLGAHAIPTEYRDRREDYISLLTDRMLPQVAGEGLADFVDVFCDRGFFTPEETDTILEAAAKYGLPAKIHGNELANSGGVQAAVKNRALSVDHLECIGQEEIEVLKRHPSTMPCIMPGVAFFLNMNYAPARQMIDAGLPVCLATDYNPGSSPSGSMPFTLTLACLKLKMLPWETLHAATINGAYAMGIEATHGSITTGKRANLIITKPVPSLDYIPYAYGSDVIEKVIIGGEVVRN